MSKMRDVGAAPVRDAQADPELLAAAIRHTLATCPVKRLIPVLPWRKIPDKAAASGILRITFVINGKRHVRWPERKNNRYHPLGRGEALVVTPMAWTQNKAHARHRVLCVDCFPAFTRFMLRGFGGARTFAGDGIFLSGGTMAPTARSLLQALAHAAATEDQERMQPIFYCFMDEVLRECRSWRETPSGLRDWQHAVTVMHEDLSVDLRRDSIARAVQVHPNHLSRLCKRFTGQSLADYLTDYRMQRACHYLRDHERSIAEVTELSGYHDETHFRKRFKLVYGMTPGQWRKQQ